MFLSEPQRKLRVGEGEKSFWKGNSNHTGVHSKKTDVIAPVWALLAQLGSCRHQWACVCVCPITGVVPVGKSVASWSAGRFGRLAGLTMQSLAWRFWGRLSGMTMQSHSTVVFIGMVTCCQIARCDSWKPLSAPGVKSVLRGSFRKAERKASCSSYHAQYRKRFRASYIVREDTQRCARWERERERERERDWSDGAVFFFLSHMRVISFVCDVRTFEKTPKENPTWKIIHPTVLAQCEWMQKGGESENYQACFLRMIELVWFTRIHWIGKCIERSEDTCISCTSGARDFFSSVSCRQHGTCRWHTSIYTWSNDVVCSLFFLFLLIFCLTKVRK